MPDVASQRCVLSIYSIDLLHGGSLTVEKIKKALNARKVLKMITIYIFIPYLLTLRNKILPACGSL